MPLKTPEQAVAEKIIEFSDETINYLEKNFYKLSPAGKYNACMLAGAIILNAYDLGVTQEQAKNQRTSFALPRLAIIASIINELHNFLIDRFNQYKTEFCKGNLQNFYPDNEVCSETLRWANADLFAESIVDIRSFSSAEMLVLAEALRDYNKSERSMSFILLSLYYGSIAYFEKSGTIQEQTIFYMALSEWFKSKRLDLHSALRHLNSKYYTSLLPFKYHIQEKIRKRNSNYNNNSSSNQSCYIATLAYQDINHPKVEIFRQFRDNTLVNYSFGRFFIEKYYKYSPKIVEFLRPFTLINYFIRKILDIIILFIKNK
jgi:hypothetical protein